MNTDSTFIASDITGAAILCWNQNYNLIIWDVNGKIYFLTNIYYDKIDTHIQTIYQAVEVYGTFEYKINIYNVFKSEIRCKISRMIYNEILSRIEDIYGMSIEEFSLGQLEYI